MSPVPMQKVAPPLAITLYTVGDERAGAHDARNDSGGRQGQEETKRQREKMKARAREERGERERI